MLATVTLEDENPQVIQSARSNKSGSRDIVQVTVVMSGRAKECAQVNIS